MNTRLTPTNFMSASVERTRPLATLEELHGSFVFEHWRNGKCIGIIPFPNGATNTGKQHVLGVAFNSVTQITGWYLGLISGTAGTPTIDPADTPLSHSGRTEFVSYNETVRQTWTKGASNPTNQIVSTAPALYTVSNDVAVNAFVAGGFLVSSNVKSGTTGILYATGLFPAAVPVLATDVFKLNYATGL